MIISPYIPITRHQVKKMIQILKKTKNFSKIKTRTIPRKVQKISEVQEIASLRTIEHTIFLAIRSNILVREYRA